MANALTAPSLTSSGKGVVVAAAGGASASLGDRPVFTPNLAPGNFFRGAEIPRGRRAFNVSFSLSSANKEIVRERRTAVINAREVDRNNVNLRSALTKRAVDMVGANLRLQAMPNYEMLGLSAEWAQRFANEWENLFSLWGDDTRKLNDAARHNQFGAQMLQVCRNTYGADGEAALIIRYDEERQRRYRAGFATFVEVVDPDRISNPDNRVDNEFLCAGRELDDYGAYTALWVEKRHPSEANGKRQWTRVARETDMGRPIGVHWFPSMRPGAQRGMPAILAYLRQSRMMDVFDNKTLEQAIKAAFMSIFIQTDKTTAEALARLGQGEAAPTGDEAARFAQDIDTRFGMYEGLNAEGQAIPLMAPGDEIKIASASHASMNTDSFRFAFDRALANATGMSYARVSNDYSKTSFASIRAELIDAWRLTFADRYIFCSSVPAQIALAHLEECIVTGRIELPPGAPDFYEAMAEYSQHEWRGPAMGWVDPVKDVAGAGMRVMAGTSNPIAEAASQGGDFYDNIDATARAMTYAARKGIKLTFGQGGSVEPEPDPAEQAQLDEENGTNPPAPDNKPAPPAPQGE